MNKAINLIMPKCWIKENLKQGFIQKTDKEGIYNYYGYTVVEEKLLPNDKKYSF